MKKSKTETMNLDGFTREGGTVRDLSKLVNRMMQQHGANMRFRLVIDGTKNPPSVLVEFEEK